MDNTCTSTHNETCVHTCIHTSICMLIKMVIINNESLVTHCNLDLRTEQKKARPLLKTCNSVTLCVSICIFVSVCLSAFLPVSVSPIPLALSLLVCHVCHSLSTSVCLSLPVCASP